MHVLPGSVVQVEKNRSNSVSTEGEQNSDILAHLTDQRPVRFRVEFSFAPSPIHALQLIDENSTLYLINGDRQCEGVGFALTR